MTVNAISSGGAGGLSVNVFTSSWPDVQFGVSGW